MDSVFYIDNSLFKGFSALRPGNSKIELLEKTTFANRINALACIMAAHHGWIGATFSCAEILTYLYFSEMRLTTDKNGTHTPDILILSKGHAAPMQYACLAGKGIIRFSDLLTYKTKNGLQAHTDIKTPGIASNTGSLGQSLSKAAGIALSGRMSSKSGRIFVVLGDGELQEGQNYEALMTIKKYNLTGVIPIIDRNYLQTDSQVKDIKTIANLEKMFASFGFKATKINGHSMKEIKSAFSGLDYNANNVIIADTVKGFGSAMTAMPRTAGRRTAVWHSRVPQQEEYLSILGDLVKNAATPAVTAAYKRFAAKLKPVMQRKIVFATQPPSTRDVFAEKLAELAEKNSRIVVLDADLEKSMRLTGFAGSHPDRFIEIGIAEQDMVSVAGGLALRKYIPVVNTYASFFRRAYEQIYINSTENTFIIYAGHYSGLCYATDGKSHQMTGDIPMMRAIPGMRVYDPFCNEELENILEFYLNRRASEVPDYPIYIKLRRSPVDFPLPDWIYRPGGVNKGHELVKGKGLCLVPAGPHLTSYCVRIALSKPEVCLGVAAFSAQNFLDESNVLGILSKYKTVIICEEGVTAGGLGDEISGIVGKNKTDTRIIRRGTTGSTFSARDKSALFSHFGLDTAGLKKLAEQYI
jgi:transketolase